MSVTTIQEQVVQFSCNGAAMYGILSVPSTYSGNQGARGVLIVVGGPQYRVGSHRQFTLLARELAAVGIPVLRFDYRGMGDSEGEVTSFENVGEDLRAAIDQFFIAVPALREVVLWGLCDGASAAAFYAPADARVRGLVLLNPWVRTEAGAARAQLRHYYRRRLREGALWRKIFRGDFNYSAAWRALRGALAKLSSGPALAAADSMTPPPPPGSTLPERMRASLEQFDGQTLIITSGRDLTASEFLDTVSSSRQWQAILQSPSVTQYALPTADHTFSRRVCRDQVAVKCRSWIQSW